MAMTQLDKLRLMGVIKKTKIDEYDDLYIDSRSNLTIYDFLDTTTDIALKFMNNKFGEKQIENALGAIIIVLVKIIRGDLTIEDNNTYNKLISLKSLVGNFNDKIDAQIKTIIDLTTHTCLVYSDTDEPEESDTIEPKESDTDESEEEVLDMEETEEVEEDEEELSENLEKIAKLEEQINSYRERIKSLEKALEKKTNSGEKLAQKSSAQIGEIRKLKKEIEKLKKVLNKAREDSKSQESELAKCQINLDRVNKENTALNAKLKELNAKSKSYQSKAELYDKSVLTKDAYENNYHQILELMITKSLSIREIELHLSMSGNKLSYREISNIINQIKIRYYVEEKTNNFERTYHIAAQPKKCGEKINIEVPKKCLDIMIISDAHIGMLSNFDINSVNKIYEYMHKNGIKYILDLGDFFSFFSPAGLKKIDRLSFCEKAIDEVIEKYPQDKDIIHLLLGGNHDEVLFRYCIDALMKLEENRRDFISLGYEYASMSFNDKDKIGLYHPNFRLNKLSEEQAFEKIKKFSNKVWSNSNEDIDSFYANLYGHFHRFSFNNNGHVIAPSISYDRERNGAIHAKIYFDSSGNIESITFIKLVIVAKVYDQKKYEYQKVRSYKK